MFNTWYARYRFARLMGWRPWRSFRIAFTGIWKGDMRAQREQSRGQIIAVLQMLGKKKGSDEQ